MMMPLMLMREQIWSHSDFDGNEGVQPTPNITQAPEGAHRSTRGKAKEYPPAVWRRGADGKMERVSLSLIRKG